MDSDTSKWENWVRDKNMTGHQLLAGGKQVKPIFYYTIFDGNTLTPPIDTFGTGIPVFIIIDTDGTIIEKQAPRPSEDEIKPLLDQLLAR